MTVCNLKTKQIYSGDGVRRVWEIPFPFVQAAHIRLWRVDAHGRAVEKTDGFTVDELEKEIIYPLEDSLELPLQAGELLVLERQTPLTQETDLKRQAALDAQGLEDALDAGVLRAQELAEGLSRAIKFPVQTQGAETDASAYITQLMDVKENTLSACTQAQQAAQQAAQESSLCAQTAQDSTQLALAAKAQAAEVQPQIESAKNAALQAQTASESAQAGCEQARQQCGNFAQVCAAAQEKAESAQAEVSANAQRVNTQSAQAAQAAELAQNWASKTDGPVEGEIFSAKKYAQEAAQSAQSVNGKANADLSNCPSHYDYVVEHYNDGAGNWYRKYKSGWLEQGGTYTTDSDKVGTITYLKPFSAVPSLLINVSKLTDGATFSGNANWDYLVPYYQTATSFTIKISIWGGRWEAKGQGAA